MGAGGRLGGLAKERRGQSVEEMVVSGEDHVDLPDAMVAYVWRPVGAATNGGPPCGGTAAVE